MKKILLIAALFVALPSSAQTTVSQGNGSASVAEWRVNSAANRAGKTTEVLVDNTTVTLMPTTALTSRKAIELQNLGPNPIYCTVGGETPLTTGALGRRIDASGGTWSLDVGPGVVIKCLAGTADQVTTAATQVTELR